jgi:hypothetical protein
MKISLSFLVLLLTVPSLAQTSKGMNKTSTKKIQAVYLGKQDSIFITIQQHAIKDLKNSARRADSRSAEGKLKAEEIKSWNEEKRGEYNDLFETTVRKYMKTAEMDFDVFMLLFFDFATYEDSVISAYDFRVRVSANNIYVAEFWEDGLIANSEANALIWAKQLLERFPEDDSTSTVNTVKETYAAARKVILDGEQPRYSKVMALLYRKEKNEILFQDPFQALIDFI